MNPDDYGDLAFWFFWSLAMLIGVVLNFSLGAIFQNLFQLPFHLLLAGLAPLCIRIGIKLDRYLSRG